MFPYAKTLIIIALTGVLIAALGGRGEDPVAANFNRGCEQLAAREPLRAVYSFTEVLEEDPDHGEAYLGRGCAKMGCGDFFGALADLSQAAQRLPENPVVYRYQGLVYLYSDDMHNAADAFTEAIRVSPDQAALYHLRALAILSNGQVDRALDDLDRALQLDAADCLARATRAAALLQSALNDVSPHDEALHKKSLYHEALADADEALRAAPENPLALLVRGMIHAKLGSFDLSQVDLARAVAFNPRLAEVSIDQLFTDQTVVRLDLLNDLSLQVTHRETVDLYDKAKAAKPPLPGTPGRGTG